MIDESTRAADCRRLASRSSQVKSRAKHQKRTGAKANAGTVTDGDGDSSDNQSAADKKKTKRRKANRKRKERMKAAMVLLKEQEKADKVDESVPPTLEKVPNRAIRFAVLDSYNMCCRIDVPNGAI